MPRRCCVPGCNSNYDSTGSKVSTFGFPTDPGLLKTWVKSIHREAFTPTASSSVCIKHFAPQYIKPNHDDNVGENSTKRPRLMDTAVPTLFPGQPSYMSCNLPQPRKLVNKLETVRQQEATRQNMEILERDIIKDFNDFEKSYLKIVNTAEWVVNKTENFIFFAHFNYDSNVPRIEICCKVLKDLSLEIFRNDVPVSLEKFENILDPLGKCSKWSMFENLFPAMLNYSKDNPINNDKLAYATKLLVEIIQDFQDERGLKKLLLVKEQLSLMNQNAYRYTADFLCFSCYMFYSNPSAYKILRDSQWLTLPSPSYLKKFSPEHFHCSSVDSHYHYLRQRVSNLKEEEKLVCVMLDEIHIKSNLSYKGGKLHGSSINSSELASSLQVFMITSIFSSYKDVVALYPVKKMNAVDLYKYTNDVLKVLHEVGYKVISLISDNNRVNRKMFEIFCNGSLKPFIENPYQSDIKLFFLFDTVHLLKCIRNNWFNVKHPIQTFELPNFENHNVVENVPLLVIRNLYMHENQNVVKFAPSLSQKVLYPSSFERQNVNYVLSLFNEKVVAALKVLYPEETGVINFISIIQKWWNMVNVKTPFKGHAKRLDDAKPIYSENSSHLTFLLKFVAWLDHWNDSSEIQYSGKLTKETYFALRHTTSSLVELTKYLFREFNCSYVLLGKFQTDKLEERFGLYRRMSGCNYNVSVAQVYESEKKLKLLNVLKVRSKSQGVISFTSISDSYDGSSDDNSSDSLKELFSEIHDNVRNSSLSSDNYNIIMYIAGYVAKSVCARIKCCSCSSYLSQEKSMDVECKESSPYLQLVDRGGLRWPTDMLFEICSNTFLIFENIIENYEDKFLQVHNQRNVLLQCSVAFHEYLPDDLCTCKRSLTDVVKYCLRSMTNILLNNYSKVQRNKFNEKQSSKRKLSTLI